MKYTKTIKRESLKNIRIAFSRLNCKGASIKEEGCFSSPSFLSKGCWHNGQVSPSPPTETSQCGHLIILPQLLSGYLIRINRNIQAFICQITNKPFHNRCFSKWTNKTQVQMVLIANHAKLRSNDRR